MKLRVGSSLPSEVRLFLQINVALGLLCLSCEAFWRFVLHYPGIYDNHNWPTLLFFHWRDFWCWNPRLQYLHTMRFFDPDPALDQLFMYPAPGAGLYEAFYIFGAKAFVVFATYTTTCVTVAVVGFYCAIRRAGLAISPSVRLLTLTFLFSFPLWFEFDLGNMEICIWIFIAAGMWAYLEDRMYLAATLFALAASVKLFPFVYFGIFLARKRYAPIVYAAVLIAALNAIFLWMIYPSYPIALHGVQQGMASFHDLYVIPYHFETSFDHSIFAVLKTALAHLHAFHPPLLWAVHIGPLASAYLPVMACIGLFLYFKYIQYLPLLNQVLTLCVISISFPPTSHDYTLLHLYVPWALMVLFAIRKPAGQYVPGLVGAFVCMAVLMSPETEFLRKDMSYGGQIKAVALVVLLVIGLRYPFTSTAETAVADPQPALAA